MDDKAVTAAVRTWVEQFVVRLELCPFAAGPFADGRVRIAATAADTADALIDALADELAMLKQDSRIETTLLVHPCVLGEFSVYNQFLDAADGLLVDMDLDGEFQIASFHPQYRFAGTAVDDAENYSNRSPWPLLHILREASVERAVATHPDTAGIPRRNIEQLRRLGPVRLRALLMSFRSASTD